MRLNQSDIIEDVLAHIRQLGGEFSEWCVGTAKDSRGPFGQHGAENAAEELIYREAYTPYAAAEVVERLAGCALRPERGAAAGSFVFARREAVSSQLSAVSQRTACHGHPADKRLIKLV